MSSILCGTIMFEKCVMYTFLDKLNKEKHFKRNRFQSLKQIAMQKLFSPFLKIRVSIKHSFEVKKKLMEVFAICR